MVLSIACCFRANVKTAKVSTTYGSLGIGSKSSGLSPIRDMTTASFDAFYGIRKLKQSYPPKFIWARQDSKLTPEDCYDVNTYRKRHIIERFFGRLKENKRIAMRYDKLDHTFLSFIFIAIAKLYKLLC